MQIYKNILVTIDCSSVDQSVIDHVSKLAIQNKSHVSLLHVVHAHTLDQDRVLRETAESTLADYAKTLTALGIKTSTLIHRGEPEDEITSVIETGDFDLVAMATHGHSLLSSLLFGSVSRSLKRRVTVPLLLISQTLR